MYFMKGEFKMANRDTAIRALAKSLGDEYCVRTIDLERVVYRDFAV